MSFTGLRVDGRLELGPWPVGPVDLEAGSGIRDGEDEAADEHEDDSDGQQLLEVGKTAKHF